MRPTNIALDMIRGIDSIEIDEARLVQIAQAIQGPWTEPPPQSKFSQQELRQHRWEMMLEQDRRQRLLQAKSVIEEINKIVAGQL